MLSLPHGGTPLLYAKFKIRPLKSWMWVSKSPNPGFIHIQDLVARIQDVHIQQQDLDVQILDLYIQILDLDA